MPALRTTFEKSPRRDPRSPNAIRTQRPRDVLPTAMILAIFPAAILVLGLLAWALSSNPKVADAGQIAFAVGLLVLAFVLARHTIKIG